MGLLDDAIREHLELKRRRGADPTEIDRLEHEALGPVRREPFERASAESGSPVDVDESPPPPSELGEPEYEDYYEEEYYEEEGGADWVEPSEEEFERPAPRRRRGEDLEDPPPIEPEPEAEQEHRSHRWRLHRRESIPPEEAPPTQSEPPDPGADGEETIEYRTEDVFGAEGGGRKKGPAAEPPEDKGDVLEETPEFLQDAPEHDRLWFEQRPPRDFDFDE